MSLVQSDTPMMKQFNALKKAHPDCILFFRAGDFYEMFGEDAVKASEALGIALTTRNKSSQNPVPMAGVPHHAFETYLNRLTAAGFKVAIAEQMEDPAQAQGVVRREVVRVVTPGTVTSDASLEGDRPHYLMAVSPPRGSGWGIEGGRKGGSRKSGGKQSVGCWGLAMVDLSTGHFEVLEFPAPDEGRLFELIALEHPREILIPESESGLDAGMGPGAASAGNGTGEGSLRAELERRLRASGETGIHLEPSPRAWFAPQGARKRLKAQYETAGLEGFGIDGMNEALGAAGALLAYLEETQKSTLTHLAPPHPRLPEQRMWLDGATVEHLELFENRSPGGSRHTLFAVLNQTRTAMGARMLRRWLAQPLLSHAGIAGRHQAVEALTGAQLVRDALREAFARVRDLERIIGRVSMSQTGIADMVALREALGAVQFLPPLLGELLGEFTAPLLEELSANFDPMEDIYGYLRERFLAEPALKLFDGGYIGKGVIPELDSLRELSRDSRKVITELEAREREQTGIPSLKVRYNRVFGYYLEISKTHQQKVPGHYVRKQTLVNAERYTMTELEEIEEKIVGAEERIADLEYAEFGEVRTILRGYARRMQQTAARIATLDVLAAFAESAHRHGYTRPQLIPENAPRGLEIAGGRHPVIERIDFEERFIPNGIRMSVEDAQILLITGPNMAGKSTFMRQVALIQLMAQAGSFVPADSARLPLVDRIFTRVGASDSLSRGQSTFMVEMNEAANILNNATPESLIVLDEIGRGTSTYDGISIAWAMVEHIHRLGALTLFATHYHELTQLANELTRLKNFTMSIMEEGDRLVFTRKLTPGEADKSYGIQVARLAGLPAGVLERAHEVMDTLVSAGNGAAVMLDTEVPDTEEEAMPAGKSAVVGKDSGVGKDGRARKGGRDGRAGKDRAAPDKMALARQQLSFLSDAHPMLEQIRSMDMDELTPRKALDFLYSAKAKLERGEP